MAEVRRPPPPSISKNFLRSGGYATIISYNLKTKLCVQGYHDDSIKIRIVQIVFGDNYFVQRPGAIFSCARSKTDYILIKVD